MQPKMQTDRADRYYKQMDSTGTADLFGSSKFQTHQD